MFDNRHCTKKDLELLVKETSVIKKCILFNSSKIEKSGIDIIEAPLRNYFDVINRFDSDIASKMQFRIEVIKNDYKKIISIIDECFENLKQNVVVDIREHQI